MKGWKKASLIALCLLPLHLLPPRPRRPSQNGSENERRAHPQEEQQQQQQQQQQQKKKKP